MRLTNYARQNIRHRIIDDVPEVNYQEQMQTRASEICVALMPSEVRRVWSNSKLRGFVKCGRYYYCCMTLTTPGFDKDDDMIAALKADETLTALHTASDQQVAARQAIREKLRANIDSCTTDNQFRERFPELARYLPVGSAATANLPATTDLIDSLAAAGMQFTPSPETTMPRGTGE